MLSMVQLRHTNCILFQLCVCQTAFDAFYLIPSYDYYELFLSLKMGRSAEPPLTTTPHCTDSGNQTRSIGGDKDLCQASDPESAASGAAKLGL